MLIFTLKRRVQILSPDSLSSSGPGEAEREGADWRLPAEVEKAARWKGLPQGGRREFSEEEEEKGEETSSDQEGTLNL